MPHIHEVHAHVPEMDKQERTPNRLILCFDGTGNEFMGNSSDTNIVKLYNMFNRDHPHQMHYYQPGIGTYTGDGSSVNQSWWGKTKASMASTVDEGFATTFDAHVIAGYRFLMRYYGRGDPIYIFGFSRGAFTARFLARMVSQVGLLSMGNEELVPFAYRTYQNYELGQPSDQKPEERRAYIDSFKSTFCRHEHADGEEHSNDEAGIKVHFLGLFDTVNSVGTLEVPFSTTVQPPEVHGTAEHVRHAVAVDERRVKFKPALLQQDVDKMKSEEDIKEVWFPGNHGDIGGGWPAETPKMIRDRQTFGGRVRATIRTWTDKVASLNKEEDAFQLSDIALKWMVDELDHLPGNTHGNGDQVEWHAELKESFMRRFYNKRNMAIKSPLHDTMVVGGGLALGKVLFWNFMEYLPFIKRWEYRKEKGKYQWCYDTFPLNMGGTRDIPPGATLHYSVLERMKDVSEYRPTNDVNVTRTIPSLTDVTVKSLKHVELDYAVDEASTPYQPVYPAQSWWQRLLVSLRIQNPPEPLARVYWHEKRGKELPFEDGPKRMTDTTYTISLDPPTGEEEPEQMPVINRPKLPGGYGASNGHSSSHEHSSNHTYTTNSTSYEFSSGLGSRTKHEFSSNHQAEEGRNFV